MGGGLRDPTTAERALLDALLSFDFEGVEALRVQAAGLKVSDGCTCGCGTINLFPSDAHPPLSDARSPVPAEGRVVNGAGEDVGGLLLFLEQGRLSSLEVYSYDEPLALPEPDHVIWDGAAAGGDGRASTS
ncbi:hypothetical protein [Aeromicrobium sp. CnD17-E]|uniref:hypothetical protein n=1 Tax=Aeromicrobium sp. CnD17-E TaxID=2954487 RepID=UPI00209702F0|nr:hypothetical protein [Aeromicrobium sp. CnD17-E]MCO7238919.1 hypothetical protein [Aeromicrobium sp. CnD17-E]